MAPPGYISPLDEFQSLNMEIRKKSSEEKRREYLLEKIPAEALEDWDLTEIDLKTSSDLLAVARQFYSEEVTALSIADRIGLINIKVKLLQRKDSYEHALKELLANADFCGFKNKADILLIKCFIDLLPSLVTKNLDLNQPSSIDMESWLLYAKRIDVQRLQYKSVSGQTFRSPPVKLETKGESSSRTDVHDDNPTQTFPDSCVRSGQEKKVYRKQAIGKTSAKALLVGDVESEIVLDTGSDLNYLSENLFSTLSSDIKNGLNVTDIREVVYANQLKGKTMGSILLNISIPFANVVNKQARFHVTADSSTNFLGIDDCCRFKVLSRLEEERKIDSSSIKVETSETPKRIKETLDKYPYLSNDDWSKKPKHSISLDVDDKYVTKQLRSAPFKKEFKEAAREILNQNVERNFIKKVEKVTHDMEICRCMMVSQPDKDPRLVLIPKNINKHLRAEAKVMLTLKDLLKSAGSSMYSTLDIKSAYNLIDIKKEDRKFCCFSTEFGVYQASRLQFGFKDALSHFISVLDKILANIPFTAKFMDDIICYASPDSHKDTVIRIIEELGKANFKLSLKKCHFMKPAVKYIGLETTSDGIFIPNARSDSLARSRSPKSLKELTSILCCLSFYRPFIAKFPELTENLYGKKQFSWSIADEKNFREILRLVSDEVGLHCVTDTSSDFRLCLSFFV
uniref:Reverse transcriptase domain-containing protein n=1 Tax=Rhabditophanes sp. KR3021 TaxID=114890 RepID=A0AC35UGH6_9BILA